MSRLVVVLVFASLLSSSAAAQTDPVVGQLPATTQQEIAAILEAKAARAAAVRKVSSRLLTTLQRRRGELQPNLPRLRPTVVPDPSGLLTVDIRATVTPEVLDLISGLGGIVITSVPQYSAIRAQIPFELESVEALARLDAVQSIRIGDEATTRSRTASSQALVPNPVAATRKINTSEGDVAHQATFARQMYSVDGTGIVVGVLSDGVDSLADRQATGDLPPHVTILPGQAGTGDEGTAMLEIVHDLAPGAELYFATAITGQEQFAANIKALCDAGVNVIVDDILYFREAAFEDGIIAQGITAATSDGCFYFSAAGNGGNLNDRTAGVWEGDYNEVASGGLSHLHDFSGGAVVETKSPATVWASSSSGPTHLVPLSTTTTCS